MSVLTVKKKPNVRKTENMGLNESIVMFYSTRKPMRENFNLVKAVEVRRL